MTPEQDVPPQKRHNVAFEHTGVLTALHAAVACLLCAGLDESNDYRSLEMYWGQTVPENKRCSADDNTCRRLEVCLLEIPSTADSMQQSVLYRRIGT